MPPKLGHGCGKIYHALLYLSQGSILKCELNPLTTIQLTWYITANISFLMHCVTNILQFSEIER